MKSLLQVLVHRKKISVTGAITTVGVKELQTAPGGNLSNALAGNVPGIMAMQTSGQPGQNTSEFWIRGISTFGANTSALVLVDGFERDLNDVNIEDIESFSVLKDASATAIYGTRAANGVIVSTSNTETGGILRKLVCGRNLWLLLYRNGKRDTAGESAAMTGQNTIIFPVLFLQETCRESIMRQESAVIVHLKLLIIALV